MEFTLQDFARLFGLDERSLPKSCRELIERADFRYELPSPAARDEIVSRVREHIDSDRPTKVGNPQRADIWELCWSENLQKFVEGGYDPEKLVPDFIRPDQPIRLRREYVLPRNPRFELDFFKVCRAYLFDRFFRDVRSVYEFGCGSGFNLIALAQQLPGKRLCGLDWSKSSYEMVNLFREKLGIDISGRHFDFFNPDRSLDLGADAGVLTMCALEQVGPRHEEFLSYLLEKRPAICVNMEPLVELYDSDNPVDRLAVRYHRKRGYLEGFVTKLRDLESSRRVEILDIRRFDFGSMFHECYSFVAWRALR
jgi:SAM-dependent methyltransferase